MSEPIEITGFHGDMDSLQVKEMRGEREVIRMRFPGASGVDVVIVPPSPRHSPPPPEPRLLPKIKYKPLDLDIRQGKDALFELVVADHTDVSVAWSKDETLLLNSGRYKMWNDGNKFFMKITEITEKDEALYAYVVRNNIGEKKGDVQLLVNDDSDYDDEDDDEEAETNNKTGMKAKDMLQPVFLRRLKHEYIILEGSPLELVVETADEPLDVSWFYEGRKLKKTGSEFIAITSVNNVHTLFIEEAVFDDEGFYECVATYENFEISSSADVIIENIRDDEGTSDVDFDIDQ